MKPYRAAKAALLSLFTFAGVVLFLAVASPHTFPALDTTNYFTGPNNFCNINGTSHIGTGHPYQDCWGSADVGAQFNAAYAASTNGGKIEVDTVGAVNFSTPMSEATGDKCVSLRGQGSGVTTLTYTGTTGSLLTLECAQQQMSYGVRDLTIKGPGSGTATVCLALGVSSSGGIYGAGGSLIENVGVFTCGVNIQYGDNTYFSTLRHVFIAGGGTNILYPSGLSNSGERMTWSDITSTGLGGVQSNVLIHGPGEFNVDNMSIDQSQIILDNNLGAGSWFNFAHGHGENPQGAQSGPEIWNKGYYTTISDSDFINDFSPAPTALIQSDGGDLISSGNAFGSLSGTVSYGINATGGKLYATGTRTSFSAGNPTKLINAAATVQATVMGPNEGFSIADLAAQYFDVGFGIDTNGANHNRWRFSDNGNPCLTAYAWSGVGNLMTPWRECGSGGGISFMTGSNAAPGSETYTNTAFVIAPQGAKTVPTTVGVLIGCSSGVEGSFRAVTDSTTNTWGATATGGGTNHVMIYCDGSAWTVAAK